MKRTPFTKKQVTELNDLQSNNQFHGYTCCSHNGCTRSEKNNWGKLLATKDGWICPCGKYKQNWAH